MDTKKLRDLIFKEIEDLNSGKSTKEKANSISRLANSAISAKRLEIEVLIYRAENSEDEGSVEL